MKLNHFQIFLFLCFFMMTALTAGAQNNPVMQSKASAFVDGMKSAMQADLAGTQPTLAVLAVVERQSRLRTRLSVELEDSLLNALVLDRDLKVVPLAHLEEIKAQWNNQQDSYSSQATLEAAQQTGADWWIEGYYQVGQDQYVTITLSVTEVQTRQPLYLSRIQLDAGQVSQEQLAPLGAAPLMVAPATSPAVPVVNQHPVASAIPQPEVQEISLVLDHTDNIKYTLSLNEDRLDMKNAEEIGLVLIANKQKLVLNQFLQPGRNVITYQFAHDQYTGKNNPNCAFLLEMHVDNLRWFWEEQGAFSNCKLEGQGKIEFFQQLPDMALIEETADTGLKPFLIDYLETPVQAFRQYLVATKQTRKQPGDNKLPQTSLTWDQANAYCQWRNKRLPSAAEWRFAAMAGAETRWPWGDDEVDGGWFHDARANLAEISDGNEDLATVEAYHKTEHPFGLKNVVGNAAEWTSNRNNGQALVLGGSFQDSEKVDFLKGQWVDANEKSKTIGIRCAANFP